MRTLEVDDSAAGVSALHTKPASAAAVGKSNATVAGRAMPNLAAIAFLSSTAPRESRPAYVAGKLLLAAVWS